MAPVTEAGIRKAAVEPERERTEVEPEEWSPEAADGQRQTKVEPEGRGSLAELVN